MNRMFLWMAGILVCIGLAGTAFFTRDFWLPAPPSADPLVDEQAPLPFSEPQKVKLSPQAQANLKLRVQPLSLGTYWKTVPIPGVIVDRPAQSDRGVVAPLSAVVLKVHRFPGETVRPGDLLFTLKLLSEAFQLSQTELFRTVQDTRIAEEKQKRLAAQAALGTLPRENLMELEGQIRRLKATSQAYRQELLSRGLTPPQIDDIAEGRFVSEIEVKAPVLPNIPGDSVPTSEKSPSSTPETSVYEMQELRVDLGQQVQAGQTLCLLSRHQALFIEGRAFRQETPLIEKAAQEGWPVEVDFLEEAPAVWPAMESAFPIRHIANTIDPASRSFAFYLALQNQSRLFDQAGRSLILWRFRPGQRVRLQVRVEKFENVLVIPAEGVVREGPEAYVFRQNGDLFERKAVHVLYQDRQNAVLANDGAVPPGIYVAQNGAAQINRVLKSQDGGLPPGFHMHADGSIHSNAAHK